MCQNVFDRKTNGHIRIVNEATVHSKRMNLSLQLNEPRPKRIRSLHCTSAVWISFCFVLQSVTSTQSKSIKIRLCLPTCAVATCLLTMLHRPISVILTNFTICEDGWTEAGMFRVIRTVICSHLKVHKIYLQVQLVFANNSYHKNHKQVTIYWFYEYTYW